MDDYGDDSLNASRSSPATDTLARAFRWVGLVGAMGLIGIAVIEIAK